MDIISSDMNGNKNTQSHLLVMVNRNKSIKSEERRSGLAQGKEGSFWSDT